MSATPLLDLMEARKLRDEAIERVERNADSSWFESAMMTVCLVASLGRPFTSDTIWATGLPKPREPRALGAVMKKLARDGKIRRTGRYVDGKSATRHLSPVAEWVKS